MYSRKELTTIFIAATATLLILLVVDKWWVLSNISLSHQPIEADITVSHNVAKINAIKSGHHDPITASVGGIVNQNVQSRESGLPTVSQEQISRTQEPVRSISNNKKVSKNEAMYPIVQDNTCPQSMINDYRSVKGSESLRWCQNMQSSAGIIIGRSWGSMNSKNKLIWDKFGCNELLKLGRLQSCDERYGWKFLEDWRSKPLPVVSGISNVKCIQNLKTSTFCSMKNTVLDFSKMRIVDRHSRTFDSGFIQTFGQRDSLNPTLEFPGYAHSEMAPRNNGEKLSSKEFTSIGQCDTVIEEPTFVLSNDDIYNLGHYINDVMGIWAMSVLANRDTKSSILLNIDGFRRGGPAGGHPHRLMEPSDPDRHGPYIGYYDSWFRRIDKATDYAGRRVCFRELYFPPEPGVPWFWNDWSLVNSCSMQAPSPLYQSFNYFLRERWAASNRSLQHQKDIQDDVVHVVIEVRSINPNKAVKKASTSRHIRNLDALLNALREIPQVKVTAQDFALIPFEEQVALSHSAGVFMSMHGAGTTHIFHMAVGSPNCCALVELQPDHSLGFQNAQGYGNLARMMGLHHYRYEAADGLSTELGTEVEVNKVKDLVQQAVKTVRSQRTCLLDAKDSRSPLYDKEL